MKLSPDIRIPDYELSDAVTAIRDEFRRHALQVNLVSEGRIAGHYNARSSVPTDPGKGDDFVSKTGRSVQGATGAKYIVMGWTWTGGDAGAWQECRVTTGT